MNEGFRGIMARNNFLICFTGIDGSGKTTLSKELVELLNEKGKRRAIENHSFLSSVYQRILLFDYVLQIFFKVKLPLMFSRRNIVCDRYMYDTVITDISIDMKYSKNRISNLLNRLLHFFPKPDIAFLIDVPEEIAYQRKDDTLAIEYLKERRDIYLDIGKEYDMIILDGSKSLEELKNSIQKEVFEMVKIK
jgi:dTMP kinase